MLTAQEVDDPADRPAKTRQRAEDIPGQLDMIRHGLLAGTFSRREIEGLASMAWSSHLPSDDPKLAEIVDQIELRAEIELAKQSTLD